MRRNVLIGIGAVAALAVIVLLIGWLGFGWFRGEAASTTTEPVTDPAVASLQTQIAMQNQAISVLLTQAAVTPLVVPTVTPAPVVQTNSATSGTSSDWTPAEKCAWLNANFPQTTEGVQALGAQLASVQTQRVRTHLYPCSGTVTAFDGLIILGPNEGYSGSVTMSVPPNGAIDSYVGASFTGNTQQIGVDTVRGFDGKVTATTMTYWPWLDENPPVGSVTTSNVTTTGQCIDPTVLATQQGWRNDGWADQTYGGLRVELTTAGQLPPMWEAVASGRSIKESDVNREMVATVWTVYPPFACRDELGYSK